MSKVLILNRRRKSILINIWQKFAQAYTQYNTNPPVCKLLKRKPDDVSVFDRLIGKEKAIEFGDLI